MRKERLQFLWVFTMGVRNLIFTPALKVGIVNLMFEKTFIECEDEIAELRKQSSGAKTNTVCNHNFWLVNCKSDTAEQYCIMCVYCENTSFRFCRHQSPREDLICRGNLIVISTIALWTYFQS